MPVKLRYCVENITLFISGIVTSGYHVNSRWSQQSFGAKVNRIYSYEWKEVGPVSPRRRVRVVNFRIINFSKFLIRSTARFLCDICNTCNPTSKKSLIFKLYAKKTCQKNKLRTTQVSFLSHRMQDICKLDAVFNGTLQLHCKFRDCHKMSSVCLSSTTRVYCDKVAEARIMQFSLKCID